MVRENNEIRAQADESNRTRDRKIEDQSLNIQNLERLVKEMDMKMADHKEMKSLNDRLNKDLNSSEQNRKDLQNERDRAAKEMTRKHQQCLDEARAEWRQKEDDYQATIRKRDDEINQLKNTLNETKAEVERQRCEILALKDENSILEEVKKQRDTLQEKLKDYQDSRDRLHKEIEKFRAEYEALRK